MPAVMPSDDQSTVPITRMTTATWRPRVPKASWAIGRPMLPWFGTAALSTATARVSGSEPRHHDHAAEQAMFTANTATATTTMRPTSSAATCAPEIDTKTSAGEKR